MSNKYFQIIKEYSIVTLACIVMAFNINYFFLANKLAEGGIAGISLIIHYLTNIDIGYLYFILNIPLIILAYMFIGKDFLIKTLDEFFSNKKYRESETGKKILDEYLNYMGIILKNLLFTYNPKKLIICGELSQYGNYLLDDILNIVYEKNHIFYRGRETISFSNFKGSSSIIGAALFPIVDNLM